MENPEKQPHRESMYKYMFGEMFRTQNIAAITNSLHSLYNKINSIHPETQPPDFPSQQEIERMIKSGDGEILVGTGTAGQRVFFQYGPPYMHEGSGRIFMSEDKYGEEYREAFRNQMDLPEGEYELLF